MLAEVSLDLHHCAVVIIMAWNMCAIWSIQFRCEKFSVEKPMSVCIAYHQLYLPSILTCLVFEEFLSHYLRSGGATPGCANGWKIHHPGYCFASVMVWTENKNVTISDHFVLFWQWTNQRRWRPVFSGRWLIKVVSFFKEKSASPDKILAMPLTPGALAWGFSDLEMTWLLYSAGAASVSTNA